MNTTKTEPRLACAENLSSCRQDAAFVARLVRDEPGSWRDFDLRYSRAVYAAISRVRSRFPGLMSSDDVQEIYARFSLSLISENRRKLRLYNAERGARLSSWLTLLATHAAYDFLRSKRRRPQGGSDDAAVLERQSAETPDAFRVTLARERVERVSQALDDLSARDQEFVALYYLEGLSPERTADALGVRVSTVYSKKHKVRARMVGLLDESLSPEGVLAEQAA